jgi:hypothetical protein
VRLACADLLTWRPPGPVDAIERERDFAMRCWNERELHERAAVAAFPVVDVRPGPDEGAAA